MIDNDAGVILPPEESVFWREVYLDAFINTAGGHYRRFVAPLLPFSIAQLVAMLARHEKLDP